MFLMMLILFDLRPPQLVQYKQQSRLEEKRKKALDLQLDFIVGQTERYSDLLSQSLQATPAATSLPSQASQMNAADEEGECGGAVGSTGYSTKPSPYSQPDLRKKCLKAVKTCRIF